MPGLVPAPPPSPHGEPEQPHPEQPDGPEPQGFAEWDDSGDVYAGVGHGASPMVRSGGTQDRTGVTFVRFGWLLPRRRLLIALRHATLALNRVGVDTAHTLRDLNNLKEYAMAQFDALNDRLDQLNASLDAAKQRIADDFQALRDQLANDSDDQAAVDAAVARLDASISALDSVDPDPNSPAPAEPTDPAANPNEPQV